MERERSFYPVTDTEDPKIVGRNGFPIIVDVTTDGYEEYVRSFRSPLVYFPKMNEMLEGLPEKVTGKIEGRRKALDYMAVVPECPGDIAVVSGKVKSVLEKLGVSKEEYRLREIMIDGKGKPFYILFSPIIPPSDFIMDKCLFRDYTDLDYNVRKFRDADELLHGRNYYNVMNLVLPESFSKRDIIYPYSSIAFFSDRIIEAFERERIVGYCVPTGFPFDDRTIEFE